MRASGGLGQAPLPRLFPVLLMPGDTCFSSPTYMRRLPVRRLMFLTRLPCPPGIDHHPAFLVRAMQWFPLLGAAVGAWGAAFFNAAALLWPPAMAAAVSTFASVGWGGVGWAAGLGWHWCSRICWLRSICTLCGDSG